MEVRARMLVERLAIALQAAVLVRSAPPFVADAFCASRLLTEGGHGLAFGTLTAGLPLDQLIERHAPVV